MLVIIRGIHRALLRFMLILSFVLLMCLLWVPDARSAAPQTERAKRAAIDSVADSADVTVNGTAKVTEADSEDVSQQMTLPLTEIKTLQTNSQRTLRYHVRYFINDLGESEVEVALIEAHWLARDTSVIVLRGRDTDMDQRFDSWFYSDGVAVRVISAIADSIKPWNTIRKLLLDFSLDEGRWVSSIVAKEILAEISLTVDDEIQNLKDLEHRQIDLLDLDQRIITLEKKNDNPLLLIEMKRLSKASWSQLLHDVTENRIMERQRLMIGDAGLFAGGGLLFKGLKIVIARAIGSPLMTSVKSSLRAIVDEQAGWLQKVRFRAESGEPLKKGILQERLVGDGLGNLVGTSSLKFGSVREALVWLTRDSLFNRSLKSIAKTIQMSAQGVWGQRGYIATSQTLQLAVESYARGYWQFSKEPLILDEPVATTQEFFEKVADDKGLKQNFGYMTVQTTLLSGVTDALTRQNRSLGVKYAICSAITLIDSTTMNIFVQGRTDMKRVAFDTGWELLVGGGQIQLDLFMIRSSEKLAAQLRNPKLRLVGYLLGSVDQLAGYVLYNKTTSTFFESGSSDATTAAPSSSSLVPVPALPPNPAPSAHPGYKHQQPSPRRHQLEKISTIIPPVVVVPVLAPQER